MRKIKVGDTVVCTEDLIGQFTKGKTYKVIYSYEYAGYGRLSFEQDDSGESNGWVTKYFRPVTTKLDKIFYNEETDKKND